VGLTNRLLGRDKAYQQGWDDSNEDTEEFVSALQAHNEIQAGIISQVVDVLTANELWGYVPVTLKDKLRDYV
jgi:hypothetical protein